MSTGRPPLASQGRRASRDRAISTAFRPRSSWSDVVELMQNDAEQSDNESVCESVLEEEDNKDDIDEEDRPENSNAGDRRQSTVGELPMGPQRSWLATRMPDTRRSLSVSPADEEEGGASTNSSPQQRKSWTMGGRRSWSLGARTSFTDLSAPGEQRRSFTGGTGDERRSFTSPTRKIWAAASSPTAEEEAAFAQSIRGKLFEAEKKAGTAGFWLTTVPVALGCFVILCAITAWMVVQKYPGTLAIVPISALISLLSMLPTDTIAISFSYAIMCIALLGAGGYLLVKGTALAINLSEEEAGEECSAEDMDAALDPNSNISCSWAWCTAVRWFLTGLAMLAMFVCSMRDEYRRRRSTEAQPGRLMHLFKTAGLVLMVAATSTLALCITVTAVVITYGVSAQDLPIGPVLAERWAMVVVCYVSGFFLYYPSQIRTASRTWLLSKREHGTAASIAGFLEGHAPDVVHATAKKEFRAVRLDLVEREAMATAEPDPSLYKLTFPAALGLVDAFITHSWQDDADQKWEQLQHFREEFRLVHGREAVVWIDKYCIDQNSLAEGLMCLPVFLAGCKSLLVLAGSTYPRRLWCVTELFIFLLMGKPEEVVDVRLLCPKGSPERKTLVKDLYKFNATVAQCTKKDDEERLFGAITGAFGDLDIFSMEVRKRFTSILMRGRPKLARMETLGGNAFGRSSSFTKFRHTFSV